MTSTPSRTLIRAIIAVVLVPLIFIAAFVVPSHEPKPNDLPIAVAGSPSAVRPLLRSLGDVNVIRVSSPAAARDAVRNRSAYGAIVAGRPGSVDVASGESFVVATTLRQDALRSGIAPQQIHDLAPLPSGDPRGTSLNLVMLALLITSILGATGMVILAPALRPGQRESILAGAALAVGAGTVGLLKVLSALPGPFLGEAALFSGLALSISLIAAGLVRLRGAIGTSLSFLVFLVIANPASGLAIAPDMLPTPWRQFGPLMPPGAGGQAIRGTAFFGGSANLGPIIVLLAWIALGAGLNALAYERARAARKVGEPQPRLEPRSELGRGTA